jgi:iron complex outermembrane recepter protein
LNLGPLTVLKFGGRGAKHERTYDVLGARWNAQDNATGPVTPSPFISIPGFSVVTNIVPTSQIPVPATAYPSNFASGLNATFPRDLFRFDPGQIRDFANRYVNWNTPDNRILTSGYTVEEDISAMYLMSEFDLESVTGNFGLRPTQTKVRSLSYQALPNGTATGQCVPLQPCSVPGAIVGSRFATYLPQVSETSHDVVLPSLNVRWAAQRDVIVRASASKTIGRPNYNELAGAVALNNTLLTGSSGNPLLKPITSTNFDASVAWYFARRAYVSGSVFQQDLKDYVKAGTSQVEFFNTNTGTNSVYTVSSRIGVNAKLRGFEAALEMPIGAGFGFITNYTYVDGKDQDNVPLLGTSRNTYNLIGYYEDNKFSARLAYNYRDDYAIGFVGNGTNTPTNGVHKYKGYGSVSLSLSYKIWRDISVTFDGNNLTDPVRSTYFITENAPGYWHKSGRQYFLNLRAKF